MVVVGLEGWWRWGLLPWLSRDSEGNNEKLWQDFKASGRSFPVVMSDSEEALLCDKAEGMHALSHTFLLPTKPGYSRVQPRKKTEEQGKKTTYLCTVGKERRWLLLPMTLAL